MFDEPIISESLVEKNVDPSTFDRKLSAINEIDGYGASIVSLLSKNRHDPIRASIPIT
jgi:hypothetical protein